MAPRALSTRWFGCLLHEDGELVDERLFPLQPEAIAQRLQAIQEGEVLAEERDLAETEKDIVVQDDRLLVLEGTRLGSVTSSGRPPAAQDRDLDPGLLRQAAIVHARQRIEQQLSEPARHLEHAVAYLDESHGIENRMAERLTAWVRLHDHHLVERVEDPRELARIVLGSVQHGPDGDEGALVARVDPHEMGALRGLATSILQQAEARKPLESFVEQLAGQVAPNVAQLTEPGIAARLVRHAGGLQALAKMPASTIQMLGAEGAVFRHLTEDAPPPKHGVIYRDPVVHGSHPADRGSIARALAAKIAIAARADAFTGNAIAGQLAAELRSRVDEIRREGRRRASRKRGGKR